MRHHYGPVIGTQVDPFRERGIHFESGLEWEWLQVLISSPLVVDVREQQLLEVTMSDGRRVKHYFDLVVYWKDGTVSANACKLEEDIDDDLLKLLARAADMIGDAFADEYVTLSEVGLSKRRLWNARQVIECGKEYDIPAQAAIRAALPSFGTTVSLVSLDAVVGDGDRGSRAAIAMSQQGPFGVGPRDWIGYVTELRNLFTN